MFVERDKQKIKGSVKGKEIKDIIPNEYGIIIIFTDDTELLVQTLNYNILLDEKFYNK